MAKINGIQIHVEKESLQNDVELPSHPVEKGINLTDHVEREPVVLSISGKLIRPDNTSLETLIGRLSTIETKGTAIVYEGRRIYHNLMIAAFSYDADSKIMNGFNFSMKLKEVRFAAPSYVSLPAKAKSAVAGVSSVGRKQTVNKKQSPIYHVTKKGDTYYGVAIKYGVNWQDVQKNNKYPATQIPIGVKIKVG
ncbi:LysM peptidoglycan-binding domain-containing protein [Psychrobacillus vulpis]|uniref:LysM peptidoglycan-binding domain-containing protein n=1 Tax=Psychrobacillus vulpis TaxID=2325572 RepID=A0A544TWG6_9BACI|nr:LysM domain-containing protein [Psychrobacillus vulpis]TQR21795.1 LysM peptidoglycan-binding domain-containing protein [Psychrobacillus vulpis]